MNLFAAAFVPNHVTTIPRPFYMMIEHTLCEIMKGSKTNTSKSTYSTAENVEIVISIGNHVKSYQFCKYHDFSSIKFASPMNVDRTRRL